MTLHSSDPETSASQPLVSIVVPAYNHATYLGQTIRSVLEQDYPRIELIVIDDGSTDNTVEILRGFGNAFLWESQPNMGQALALNRGWSIARGEILSYLSADDRLLPGAVSAAVETLDANRDIVLTYCDFNIVDHDLRVMRHVRTAEFSYLDMVVNTSCTPGPGVFFRREAYNATGGWDPRFRQMPDFDYWLRLGLRGPFLRIRRTLAEFRTHGTSQTASRTSTERAEEPVQIIEKYYAMPGIPQPIAAARDRALGSAHLTSAQLHLRSGRYRNALAHVRAAINADWIHAVLPRTYRLCAHGLLSRPVYAARARLRRLSRNARNMSSKKAG